MQSFYLIIIIIFDLLESSVLVEHGVFVCLLPYWKRKRLKRVGYFAFNIYYSFIHLTYWCIYTSQLKYILNKSFLFNTVCFCYFVSIMKLHTFLCTLYIFVTFSFLFCCFRKCHRFYILFMANNYPNNSNIQINYPFLYTFFSLRHHINESIYCFSLFSSKHLCYIFF